jgi:hypothetical protein
VFDIGSGGVRVVLNVRHITCDGVGWSVPCRSRRRGGQGNRNATARAVPAGRHGSRHADHAAVGDRELLWRKGGPISALEIRSITHVSAHSLTHQCFFGKTIAGL